jgi:drug/metabolite transporter (DMT)-like permease
MKKHISSQAIIYMLISCFCSALMVNLVRHLSDIGMHPFEMIFWRNLLAFAMLLPFVPVKKAHFFLELTN